MLYNNEHLLGPVSAMAISGITGSWSIVFHFYLICILDESYMFFFVSSGVIFKCIFMALSKKNFLCSFLWFYSTIETNWHFSKVSVILYYCSYVRRSFICAMSKSIIVQSWTYTLSTLFHSTFGWRHWHNTSSMYEIEKTKQYAFKL